MSGPGPQPIAVGPILSLTTPLSAADILTLDTIPVELVPAPGAGKMVVPQSYLAQLTAGATAYAGVSLKVGFNITMSPVGIDSSFLTGAVNSVATGPAYEILAPQSDVENKALILYTDAPTAPPSGDGTLQITIFYSIVDLS